MFPVSLYRPQPVLLPLPAAGFYNGNQLLEFCNSTKGSFERGLCGGYIAGIADKTDSTTYCIPSKATVCELIDVVKLWLRDHPEKRHLSGGVLVAEALKEKFPCN